MAPFSQRRASPPGNRSRATKNRVQARRLLVESLETRALLTALPFGAMKEDTGEYMLGDVRVTVVLMESDPSLPGADNGTITYPGESPISYAPADWTPAAIAAAKSSVQAGIEWWEQTLDALEGVRDGLLNFTFDWTHADNPIRTRFEPIARKSDDFAQWMNDFLKVVGFDGGASFSTNIREFNNFQRQQSNADWAFTVFVVNDANDPDGSFAAGGTFNQAFAFAGGRFLIVPAGRPQSTIAHEAGHMFWALDEYIGGSSFSTRRGYYNTQNTNAENNPEAGFVQQPSIMAADHLSSNPNLPSTFSRTAAFNAHITSQSSREMIGWKDSDGDFIFDVLDVPFTLEGFGRYDAAADSYRFTGSSSVRTFANQNPAGLQNDITINRIRQVEYAIDGGPWTVYQTFADRTYSTNLELNIPLAQGEHTIRIRTVDTRTGVMSPEFVGTTGLPSGPVQPGLSGFVYFDSDGDGTWDTNEGGLADWAVELVDQFGGPVVLQNKGEPDGSIEGAPLNSAFNGATLTALGGDVDNHTQVVGFSGATGGTFRLNYGGLLTSSIAFNATATEVAAALEGLASINLGDVLVTKLLDGPTSQRWRIKLQGALAGSSVPQIFLNTSGLTPGATSIVQEVDGRVAALSSNIAPSAGKVFANTSIVLGGSSQTWTSTTRRLRVDFAAPVTEVSLRAWSSAPTIGAVSVGRLEAYDAAGNLLERYTTAALTAGKSEVMSIARATADIAYVIARAHLGTEVLLDSLTWGPDSAVTSGDNGAFALPNLPGGTYHVKVTAPLNYTITSPPLGIHTLTINPGQAVANVNFGIRQPGNIWHNLALPENVTGDVASLVNLLDLLAVVNWMTLQNGDPQLPPAGDTLANGFVDVDNNGICNTIDLVAIVNYITLHPPGSQGGSGEGGSGGGGSGGPGGGFPGGTVGGSGEGETGDGAVTPADYFAANPLHLGEIAGDDLLCDHAEHDDLHAVHEELIAGSSSNSSAGAAFASLSIGEDEHSTLEAAHPDEPVADQPAVQSPALSATTSAAVAPVFSTQTSRRTKLDAAIDLLAADIAQSLSGRGRLARRGRR